MMLRDPELIEERRQVLQALGFDIGRIAPETLIPSRTLVDTLNVLEAFGFTEAQVRFIVRQQKTLLTCAPRRTLDILLNLHAQGFSRREIVDMVRRAPRLITSSTGRTDAVIRHWAESGFEPSDVVMMCARQPELLANSTDATDRRLRMFRSYGFSRKEIVRIGTTSPGLLYQPPERTLACFRFLDGRGFSPIEVRGMMLRFPSLARSNPRRLAEMLDVFAHIGFDLRTRPNMLAFSPKLLRGRIAFLAGIGKTKWPGCLFQSNPIFKRVYGKTREEMIALDPGAEAFRRDCTLDA